MDFGKNISRLRKEKNLSQEKLAELLGVSRQAVTKWENGKGNPDTENLIRLAEVFECSLDELCCQKAEEKPKAKIQTASHLLALISLLIAAAYCVFGNIAGNFSAGTLILILVLAIPMHGILHLAFWGMVKSGDFSMLAGYDSTAKYDTEGMKKYISGLDFMTGLTTASYLFIIASTALFVPEIEIIPVLLLGYITSFVAVILFMGYKFSDEIYFDPAEAKKAKRGFPSSAILVLMMILSAAVFAILFEMKGYENNTSEPLPMLGIMFVSIVFSLGGYLAESARLKKTDKEKPLFGKAFVICNILAIAAMIVMAIL